MKNFKVLTTMALVSCMVVVSTMNLASAANSKDVQDKQETINTTSIPKSYNANSTIEYTDNNNWKVVVKGKEVNKDIANDSQKTETNKPKNTEMLSDEQEKELLERLSEEAKKLPVHDITIPEPSNGMRVTYDAFGNVDEISIKNEDGTYSVVRKALHQGTRKPEGVYTYGKVEPNDVGYTTNTIEIHGSDSGYVLGKGDLTVFTDEIGDTGNNLKKGDCATKGDTDNPTSGTTIEVRNLTNDIKDTFIKNDNGALPNAVLDIWKTGVENLGINSDDYDNIKFAGRYYYKF